MRFMERILVVSSTEKTHAMLAQFLSSCGVQSQLCRAMAGSEARRALVDGEFALVLINTPLPDEFGHELAQLALSCSRKPKSRTALRRKWRTTACSSCPSRSRACCSCRRCA